MIGNGDSPQNQQEEPSTGSEKDGTATQLIQQIDYHLRLLGITHEAIVCVDEQCRIAVFNQGAEKLFGYQQQEIIGTHIYTLVCDRYRSEQKHRLSALNRLAKENRLSFHTDRIICKRHKGETFPAEVSLSQGEVAGHRLYTLVIRDATQRQLRERRLAYQAEHDKLTDLPNRALLDERLNAGIARADRYQRKLGVVYLDLDDFKPINDYYGHETGDFLLQAVAKRLRETMRQSDTVSRIGGDEFIVCLEQIKDEGDANAAALKMVGALKQPFRILGTQIQIAASVGIAVYPDHGRDPATLLRHADQAMYSAKTGGDAPRIFGSQR